MVVFALEDGRCEPRFACDDRCEPPGEEGGPFPPGGSSYNGDFPAEEADFPTRFFAEPAEEDALPPDAEDMMILLGGGYTPTLNKEST